MEDKAVRKSIKKVIFRGILNLLLVLIWIPFSLTFLFQDPLVQTQTARLATNVLSRQVGNEILIRRVKLNLSSGISLYGIRLKDHHDSTIISVNKLSARPRFRELGLLNFRFSKIAIDSAVFRYGRYAEDDDFNLMIFLSKVLPEKDTTVTKSDGGNFDLHAKQLTLRNSVFHFFDQTKQYDNPGGMDYADMMFYDIQLNANNFNLVNDSLHLMIDSLKTKEQCGLEIQKLTTEFTIANSGLHAQDLLLKLPRSQIDMDLDFQTKSYKTFAWFIDSVYMTGDFRPTTVDLSEIAYFAEVMNQMPNEVGVTGKVSGFVKDLSGKDLRVKYRQHTKLHLDARIIGLPDFFTSYIDADIKELSTTTCDLKSFGLPIPEKRLDFTDEIDCGEIIRVNADFKGYYKDFTARLNVVSGEGSLKGDISYTEREGDTLYFAADLTADSLNIGHFIHQDEVLGKTSFKMKVKGRGNDYQDVFMTANGTAASIELLDYKYRRLRLDASYHRDTLDANIRVGDKHLMMNAMGYLAFKQGPELYVDADISRLDLDDLGFYKDKDLGIRGDARVRLKEFNLSSMEASIELRDNILAYGKNIYHLDSLKLEKFVDQKGLNVIDLQSNILDANLTGKYDIVNFPDQVLRLFNSYVKLLPPAGEGEPGTGEYAELSVNIKRSALLEEQYLSGIELYPPYEMNAAMDFDKKTFFLSSDFDKLGVGGTLLRDNSLDVGTKAGRIDLTYQNRDILIRDSTPEDQTIFGLDNFTVRADAGSDSMNFKIAWNNKDTERVNKADIEGKLTTYNRNFRLSFQKSDVYINDTLWYIAPDNLIAGDTSTVKFENFSIYGGSSLLSLQGEYPRRDGDSLDISFRSWKLSNFDMVTALNSFDLNGTMNGKLNISVVDRYPAIVSTITIDSLEMNEVYLGDVQLFNKWNNDNQSISVDSKITRKGNAGVGEVFSISGVYFPFKKEDAIDLDISFNRFNLKAIESFFVDFVSQVEGKASGKLELTGNFSDPVLTGKIEMRRTAMNINYLNTKYSFSNEIEFEPEKIRFDKLVIYDTLGNSANVTGYLEHTHFRDQRFNVHISTDRLLFFNTTSKMNDLYYGTAITSGDIDISGSPRSIKLDMDVQTMAGTQVSLPLDYSIEISDKDYIIFIDHSDTLTGIDEELEGEALLAKDELSYDIALRMVITPEAKVTIFLPSDMGRIESQGTGDLRMRTNSTGDFTLIGDYVVSKGIFHFSLANLVSKRFSLVEGGRISWTGDPYAANVNIKGLYRVQTNLTSLSPSLDTESSFHNKVMVESYVILTDQLLDPNIRFDIKIPRLDPDQQRMVYAVLDTTNQAVMNEQMISLLVLGSFSASNAANISLSSSYYTVLSNQLSNMLSKISDDFDIGINYKPGDYVSEEEFEVALSTQLFDDRLLIDGHIGMTYEKGGRGAATGGNASNIVGDVDIGYKLTPEGRWIIKAFNHSNVNSWYNNSNYEKISPYTQGVGIAFRKEFTNIAELFQRTRPRKQDKARQNEEEDDLNENENL